MPYESLAKVMNSGIEMMEMSIFDTLHSQIYKSVCGFLAGALCCQALLPITELRRIFNGTPSAPVSMSKLDFCPNNKQRLSNIAFETSTEWFLEDHLNPTFLPPERWIAKLLPR